LKVADLFLDTWPYNCGSTTNDVLNAGLPILTVGGRTMVSRMGTSMLSALKLDSLIAKNLQDYEDRAVAFAEGKETLPIVDVRSMVSADHSKRLARSIERGLRDLIASGG
jgi:predicted O-linked N-acetylglucosamine transferase (SPINDLY family)